MNKKIEFCLLGIILVVSMFSLVIGAEPLKATVCCEQTISGLYCQDVPASECALGSTNVSTSCESTSYCKPGICFNDNQGICADSTPQLVCNNADGVWSEKSPAQCDLGCCVLGDQAAFVTLTRCKYLSSTLGLAVNYNTGINDEVSCVLSVGNQDKGACIYDFEFERTCKFTTRAECINNVNGTGISGEFFEGKLCSAAELRANCVKTSSTTCIDGRDEVYFVDSCGNPANIYDVNKLTNEDYWTNVKTKEESCTPNSGNSNSKSCGNCNYLSGSYCRDSKIVGVSPNYGDYICADLNCKNTQNGNDYFHGESWCVFDDAGQTGVSKNSVGSRFYKHICINGEEVLEQCADFRAEECIEDVIKTNKKDFSQAACRVNRWQDCTSQENEDDCVNTDRRDCSWKNKVCVPLNSPGLEFWKGEETKEICAQGNAACVVTFEKGLINGEKCVDGCECLEDNWLKQRKDICNALGDCGPNVNWIGSEGYSEGYELKQKRYKPESGK